MVRQVTYQRMSESEGPEMFGRNSRKCETCLNIRTWKQFKTPKDYLSCIAYIQQLVLDGKFALLLEDSTCPLEKVSLEDEWPDDIIVHTIRCTRCGQIFTCVVNTYRGSGKFKSRR